jgi:hypothetical protein
MSSTFDVFKDRALSLIDRWDIFNKNNPNTDAICIKGVISEVSDDYTMCLLNNALVDSNKVIIDKNDLQMLRELVWYKDIASPTCPEYIEHHRDIQDILKFIDTKLLKEDK